MARDQSDSTPIRGRDDLVAWFEEGCKADGELRAGSEHEKFPFYRGGLSPVSYEPQGICARSLEGMAAPTGWTPIMEDENIDRPDRPDRAGGAISLEPGGQFELSGAPLQTIHQTGREVTRTWRRCASARRRSASAFSALGFSPKWTLAETPGMPKSRYAIMPRYMPKVGQHGLDMMYRTCTIQANLDFADEADMVKKVRVGLALQPIATALFANSPFTEGKPNGFARMRSEVWLDTDPDRTGMLPFAFETASASSATSTGRSTCRCISSSAARPIMTSPAPRSAIC